MRLLKRFARWVLQDQLRDEFQRRQELVDGLDSLRLDLGHFRRAVEPFMRLRGMCAALALAKQEKPSSYYMVSRFDYWCLGFYWDVDMFMGSGWNPLWFRGIPIMWEGDDFFRELVFPGSENKQGGTLQSSQMPKSAKPLGCSRGQGRGEDDSFKLHKQAIIIETLEGIARAAKSVTDAWYESPLAIKLFLPVPLRKSLQKLDEEIFIDESMEYEPQDGEGDTK